MTDALEQELDTARTLQAVAQDHDRRAEHWARVTDRITSRLAVLQAETRAGLRDSLIDDEGLNAQMHATEKLVLLHREAAKTLRLMALNPPSGLLLSDEVPE